MPEKRLYDERRDLPETAYVHPLLALMRSAAPSAERSLSEAKRTCSAQWEFFAF